ncbi:HD-GYP domain-containing protein [Piscinibacter sakaiensis]|uniref:HD-GYP domain-containing protein n=1 Tax=Piscinibacter sakaiensis TaxID=1547922 RepID=UPI003AABA1F1
MSFVDLAVVQQRVTVGIPLPFDVYDADETLLLARGHVLETDDQLDQLLQRGARVGLADAAPTAATVQAARPEELPGLLRSAMALACETLGKAPTEGYEAVVDAVAEPLMAIVEADPDLAIFQIIRQEGNYLTQYGVTHSIHCAFTAFLVATRFGWSEADVRRAFNSALTMNVSMLELQGQLAIQGFPMTAAQRALIDSHPRRSSLMLEAVGISDLDWLAAVRQHHDTEPCIDSSTTVNELASLLRSADTYTAKLSPRRNREALSADVAARLMFAANRGDPATAALVKEFGLYPPGCHVRLTCGETGIVVRRGELAHIPWVAVTNDAHGRPLPEPIRRNTAQPDYKVAAVVSSGPARMRFSAETLQRVAWAPSTH